ncbi:MAG: GyrI-like domain-containing protein [Clostridiales bacterium]|jgi:hypothetical protein|nr:GyrI-like domain-containing protein [Clostridiales bacterium]
MKYEYMKQEKNIYGTTKPTILTLSAFNFICIDGVGNPNGVDFTKRVEALYNVAYAIKMKFKDLKGYFDYTVFPLTGQWTLTDKGKQAKKLNKDELVYTLMIKQPSFVTADIFNKAVEIVKSKKANELFDKIYFKEIVDGQVAQILHIGSYDNEPQSFKILENYIAEQGYKSEFNSKGHKEIYLSDARKVKAGDLKTILRIRITKE